MRTSRHASSRRAVYQRISSSPGDFPLRIDRTCTPPLGMATSGKASGGLHYHREIELQYIKRGSGAYFIGGKRYPFRRDSLLIIRPYEVHNHAWDVDSCLEKVTVMFPRVCLKDCQCRVRSLAPIPHHLRFSTSESIRVDLLIQEMDRERHSKELFWVEIVQKKLGELICLIKRAGSRTAPPRPENPIMSQLMSHLETNFSQPLGIPWLAKRFGFSESHLSRLFTKTVGLSLKQYILQRRIVEARILLERDPALKVAVVADRVGFRNFSLFNRIFKRLTRLTPADYRRISYLDRRK